MLSSPWDLAVVGQNGDSSPGMAADVMGGLRQHWLSWKQAGLACGLKQPGTCLLTAAVWEGCHLIAL